MRAVVTIFAASFALAAPALAETARGRVVVDDEAVHVVSGAGRLAIGDASLAASLLPLAGRTVTLEFAARPAPGQLLLGARVTDPPRVVVGGRRDGAALVLEDGARLTLGGPAAALVPADRAVIVDAWRLDGALVVLAVEGRTTGHWTLIHQRRGDWPTPVAVVRGRRALWLIEARGDHVRVRRGGAVGWVERGQVEAGEPQGGVPDETEDDGLDDHLPR